MEKKSTELQIRLIIAELAAVLAPGLRAPIEEVTIRGYGHYLRNIQAVILQAAVDKCVSQSRFFPAISQILDSVDEVTGRVEVETAEDAWGNARHQMFKAGANGDPDVSDTAWRVIVGLGGWKYLCLSENVTADRARFLDGYATLAERKRQIERGELIAGRLQLQLSPAYDRAKTQLVPVEGDDG